MADMLVLETNAVMACGFDSYIAHTYLSAEIGLQNWLKTSRLRACGFEPHLRYKALVAKWYTRWLQIPVVARSYRFDSCQGHKIMYNAN